MLYIENKLKFRIKLSILILALAKQYLFIYKQLQVIDKIKNNSMH